MRSIEIDDLRSWEPVYAPFFATLAPSEMWTGWLNPEDYSSADANMEKLAKFMMPSAPKPLARLRDQLDDFYKRNFTHTVFYHACRVADGADYKQHGVRLCDIAELNRQAMALWGNTEKVRLATLSPAARQHARSCAAQVGLWYSRAGAVHYGDGYTTGGSEYLRVVADALGEGQRAPLEARGRPALIKCVVPNVELHPEVLRSCASLPLRWKLTRRDPIAPANFYTLDWAFMHPHPVPPERISIEYLSD